MSGIIFRGNEKTFFLLELVRCLDVVVGLIEWSGLIQLKCRGLRVHWNNKYSWANTENLGSLEDEFNLLKNGSEARLGRRVFRATVTSFFANCQDRVTKFFGHEELRRSLATCERRNGEEQVAFTAMKLGSIITVVKLPWSQIRKEDMDFVEKNGMLSLFPVVFSIFPRDY